MAHGLTSRNILNKTWKLSGASRDLLVSFQSPRALEKKKNTRNPLPDSVVTGHLSYTVNSMVKSNGICLFGDHKWLSWYESKQCTKNSSLKDRFWSLPGRITFGAPRNVDIGKLFFHLNRLIKVFKPPSCIERTLLDVS